MEKKIELRDYVPKEETALVGRDNGEKLLKNLKQQGLILKDLEKSFDEIIFAIPANILTINKSFFLGWLETRILELGKESFKSKYVFDTEENLKDKIDSHIDAAFRSSSQDEILSHSA